MQKKYLTEVVLLTKSYNLTDFQDWLHWHLDIVGFDHCHIFDNESLVDIKSVCDKYGDRVSYEKIVGWPDQYNLYNRYINNESPAWWVLPIDDDEYLSMNGFKNVSEMIVKYQKLWPDMNKLSIRWKNMFPNDPLAERGERSLLDFCKNTNENWAKLFDGGNKPVKTFVKTTNRVLYDVNTNQTHNPISLNRPSYLCNGERLVGNWYNGPDTDSEVRLMHFQYKSKKEWIWKCNNRNRVSIKSGKLYQKCRENVWRKML